MKLPSFLTYEKGYPKPKIKIVKIDENTKVFKPMHYFFTDIDGVRYSARRYYIDERGAVRFRNWAGCVNDWIVKTNPKKYEVSQMIRKCLKPVGFVKMDV